MIHPEREHGGDAFDEDPDEHDAFESFEDEHDGGDADEPESDELLGELAELGLLAKSALEQILLHMDIEAVISGSESERQIRLGLETPSIGLVIGRKGQTLEALEHVLNKMVSRDVESRKRVVIDVAGYKARRRDGLVALAHKLGQKAVDLQRVIKANPMSAEDRRVIHLALNKFEGVTTRSEGEGIFRRLLIIPDRRRRPRSSRG